MGRPPQLEEMQRATACPGALHQAFASAVLITQLMEWAAGAARGLILAQPQPSLETHVAIASMKIPHADRGRHLRLLHPHHLPHRSPLCRTPKAARRAPRPMVPLWRTRPMPFRGATGAVQGPVTPGTANAATAPGRAPRPRGKEGRAARARCRRSP